MMDLLLARRAANERERMEDPACDKAALFRTYRQFSAINALFAQWRFLYRTRLRPIFREPSRTYRLLDVGSGGGDLARKLLTWTSADGLAVEILGIDPDPRVQEFVRARPWPEGIRFRAATIEQLVQEDERFDIVVSNNLLHHLDTDRLPAFLVQAASLARRLVLFNDIRRSPVAFALFPLLTAPFFHRSFVVADGLLSIRKSFTVPEMAALLPPGWRLERVFPYRILLSREGDGHARS